MYYTSSSDTWLVFAHAKAFFWVDHCKYYSHARNIRPAQLIWKEYNRCQHNVMRAKNLNIPETEVKAKIKSH